MQSIIMVQMSDFNPAPTGKRRLENTGYLRALPGENLNI
jgi:hypothetical protein